MCLSQIRSAHIGDAIHQGPGGRLCGQRPRSRARSAHLWSKDRGCASHCSGRCMTATGDGDSSIIARESGSRAGAMVNASLVFIADHKASTFRNHRGILAMQLLTSRLSLSVLVIGYAIASPIVVYAMARGMGGLSEEQTNYWICVAFSTFLLLVLAASAISCFRSCHDDHSCIMNCARGYFWWWGFVILLELLCLLYGFVAIFPNA